MSHEQDDTILRIHAHVRRLFSLDASHIMTLHGAKFDLYYINLDSQHKHMTWHSTQSNYTDIGLTSFDSYLYFLYSKYDQAGDRTQNLPVTKRTYQ